MSPKLPPFERTFEGAVGLAAHLKRQFVEIRSRIAGNVNPGFLNVVTTYHPGTEVQFIEVPMLSSFVFILRAGLKSKIIYGTSANKCHKRFGVCKELCHILTDDAKVKTEDPSQEIGLAIQVRNRFVMQDETLFTGSLMSEAFCVFLAFEIIVPDARREEIVQRTRLGDNRYDIATQFRIPEFYIDYFLESGYHRHWQEVRGRLGLA